ncbi:MAG: porin family protein [Alphaproteobacteria bacterium]|nr:porin family protein [Alphaproteobacteria bacterium]
MKKTFLIALGVGMFSLPIAHVSAANTVTKTYSGEGVKVINNFNLAAEPIRPAAVYAAPTPVYVAQPVPMYTQAPPPYAVPVAIDQDEVRPAVIRRVEEPERDWYAAIKYVHTLATFTSTHHTDGVYCVGGKYCVDHFNLVPMMGFALSAGTVYGDDWRFELEAGYTGQYSDSDEDVRFGISAPYLTFNALYNFGGAKNSGFYFGPGIGFAFPTTEITAGDTLVHFLHKDSRRTVFSPMLAALAGFQWKFTEQFALDIGYKFYTFSGTEHSRDFQITLTPPTTSHKFTNKTGWLVNNAFSIGLRYYF